MKLKSFADLAANFPESPETSETPATQTEPAGADAAMLERIKANREERTIQRMLDLQEAWLGGQRPSMSQRPQKTRFEEPKPRGGPRHPKTESWALNVGFSTVPPRDYRHNPLSSQGEFSLRD